MEAKAKSNYGRFIIYKQIHERKRKAGISGPQRAIGVYIPLDFSLTWNYQLWSAGS